MTATGNDNIGARLRDIRGSRTLKEMGELLGVEGNTVLRYEQGRDPGIETLRRYAELGRVTINWIIYGKEASSVVAEAPAPYGLGRSEAATVRELEALLEVADEDIKRHLRQQIELLWRAVKTTKKRKASGD